MIDRAQVVPGRTLRLLAALCAALALSTPSASAGELTALLSGAGPGDQWTRGYGGALTFTFFDIANGELEGLAQGNELPNTRFVSGTAKAYVGPTIGRIVPYAGLGVGFYHFGRQLLEDENSNFTLKFVGLKVKLPPGIVVRGEYQWLDLEEDPVTPLGHRVLVGVGLRF
jgi:opacity protein-like surface antigen